MPWAVLFILEWLRKKFLAGKGMDVVRPRRSEDGWRLSGSRWR